MKMQWPNSFNKEKTVRGLKDAKGRDSQSPRVDPLRRALAEAQSATSEKLARARARLQRAKQGPRVPKGD